MRKILFVTVIIFFDFLMIYSQDKADVEFQNYISNYETFNFDSLIVKKFDNVVKREKKRYPMSKAWGKREIDFHFKESKFEFYFPFLDENTFKCRKYILHVFENSTKIIGIICIDVYSTQPDSIKLYCNETELNKYIVNHDSLYGTKTTKYDFIKEFARDETYGYCLGDEVIDMRDRREQVGVGFTDYPNHIDKFRLWLRSYNLELQTFAIDGLDLIYEGPYLEFSEEAKKKKEDDLNIIKYLKVRNSKVWKCSNNHFPDLVRIY